MLDVLSDALAKLSEFDFVELRHRRMETITIEITDGNVEQATTGVEEGIGVRILHRGAWGFASTTSPTRKAIIDAGKEAGGLAKKGSAYLLTPVKLKEAPICEGEYHAPYKKDLRSIPVDEKLELFTEASAWVKSADKVVSHTLNYTEHIEDVSFVNSEGSSFRRSSQKPGIRASVTLRDKGKIRPALSYAGNTCGAEFFKDHDPLEKIKEAYQLGSRLLHAKIVKGGLSKVILSHAVVGLLAHEAIGHTAESDLVIAGSFLKDKIGEKIASELVSLSDSPVEGNAAGWIPVDDEGVVGKKVEIIKDGILRNYMVNRSDALKLNIEPTGNARAFTHRDLPLIRMRNTFIEAGDMTEDELIELTKDGFYIKGVGSGQADFNGEFMFGSQEALEIKNGKLTGISYVGPTISGNSFEVLQSVTGVGKVLHWDLGVGYCGKIQPARVDAGGPLLACTALLGGK